MPADSARLEVALGVLVSVAVHGQAPPREHVAALRQLASSEAERAQPIDDLARAIVERECNLMNAPATSNGRGDDIANDAFAESRDALSTQRWVSVSNVVATRRLGSGHPVHRPEAPFVRDFFSSTTS